MPLNATYRQFREKLSTVKRAHPPAGWEWYPYDSMENVPRISRLLDEAGFSLEELLDSGPVLDIGCADGDLTFFAESLGGDVDSLDYAPTNYNALQGIRKLHGLLRSQARIHEMDIDAQLAIPRPRYALCFALGLLYHLKNPFAFLETLERSVDYCFLSTRVAALFPNAHAPLKQSAAAYLVDADECNGDQTNYWIFSDAGLKRILNRTGWEIRSYFVTPEMPDSDPVRADRDQRAFCFLQSRRVHPWRRIELLQGWHAQEEQGFRWTEQQFSMKTGAAGDLRLEIYLPEVLFAEQSSIVVTAAANQSLRQTRTFTTPGLYRYSLPVKQSETIVFRTSAALAPGDVDRRERGIVVSSIEVR